MMNAFSVTLYLQYHCSYTCSDANVSSDASCSFLLNDVITDVHLLHTTGARGSSRLTTFVQYVHIISAQDL